MKTLETINATTKKGSNVKLTFYEDGKGEENAYDLINSDNFDYAEPYTDKATGFDDFNVNGEIVRKYYPTALESGKVVRQFVNV